MAHFAEIDSNNVVLRVLVVADEHEHRGQEFLANDCNLGGTWIQTSYNSTVRGKFAQAGDIYDVADDLFIPARPEEYETWTFNKETMSWIPPIPTPLHVDNYRPKWDKETQSWVADKKWIYNEDTKSFNLVEEPTE